MISVCVEIRHKRSSNFNLQKFESYLENN